MRLALDLAERGRRTARPNPMVGAVVVKDGRIVGSGYHKRPGSGHAEVNALDGVVAEGATVYVTLEPCSFTGRTPPCADLLLDRKVGRVVCAMKDPDNRVAGSGIARLKRAGVIVEVGVLGEEAKRLNGPYLTHRRLGRPYVTLKLAQSLDGSIAASSGDSKWITGPGARRRGHALRAEAQAIAVGVGTVLADDPSLDVRHIEGESPLKVILDSSLRIPLDAKVLSGAHCVICCVEGVDSGRIQALQDKGADVWICDSADGRVNLDDTLRRLASEDIIHLLIEGGSAVARSGFASEIVDRVAVFTAPRLVGGLASIGDLGFNRVDQSIRLDNRTVERLGQDTLMLAEVMYSRGGGAECSRAS